jgi:AmmeMemoRadiSam system protein A
MVQMLTREEQHRLLDLARSALAARVRRHVAPAALSGGAFDSMHGVFVTLHCEGALRGCLGRIEAEAPLARAVAELAAAVSECDPRFPPVCEEELGHLAVELSVLTPMSEVSSVDDIEVGRHGVLVESGSRRGLFLPRVAGDQGWDAQRLLEEACVKAGLRRDAWRTGARVRVFETMVFGETVRAEP